jgi:hypothetical protein
MANTTNVIYYQIKPFLPRRLQILLRRIVVNAKRKKYCDSWSIPKVLYNPPEKFLGWPAQKKFALVLTHDVETARGQEKCISLMQLEMQLGFRSSFNFVPERYKVSENLRKQLIEGGFEFGVHGLKHDGKLFRSASIFKNRAKRINQYLKEWGAVGFRAPSMHHNFEWIHLLNIEYDLSTFDTDPFEPQSDGCCSIFPYWVQSSSNNHGYMEIPYTLPQDFTVFIIMKNDDLSIWYNKLDWLVRQGGMVLLNTHPDYMCFDYKYKRYDEYHVKQYQLFLEYINKTYPQQYWNALPKEISKFWKETVVFAN